MNYLFWKTKVFLWKEQIRTIFSFYRAPRYALVDLLFGLSWFFSNPFRLCRFYYQKVQKEPLPVYGETPLSVWTEIAKRTKINGADVFIDLGCGRGKLAFWTAFWIGCKTIGVDSVPTFIDRANRLSRCLRVNNLFYVRCDLLSYPLSQATVIYLFTLHADEDKLDYSSLQNDVRIITVSERLPSSDLFVSESFVVEFPWGKAPVFIHRKKAVQCPKLTESRFR